MNSTRRLFLTTTTAAAAVSLLACRRSSAVPQANADVAPREPSKPLSMLILGGTGFIGPALVELAHAGGHSVTLFNRGRSNTHLFPDVEKLRGDRDPLKGEGLKALEGRKFDVVFDDCGYFPRMVEASAKLLSPNIGQYVFISSISAYADNSTENGDEDAKLATMEDPKVEDFGPQSSYYGPLKVLCEQAAEKACPGRTTIIRPGYIVGPGDPTHRFTWWPVRVKRGGEMLVPGSPQDPIQVIDVRDLAAFMVTVAEAKVMSSFNACGPAERLTMDAMLAACKKSAEAPADTKFTYVPVADLKELGLNPEETFPIWAPFEGSTRGFHTWSNARGVKAGMRFRPIEETISDLMAWFHSLPQERQSALKSPYTAEREQELLAGFRARR